MGEGGIKNGQKNFDVFYGRPLLNKTKYERVSTKSMNYLIKTHLQFIISFQGTPRLPNVLALFGAWTLIACCLIKGVKSSGRVSYITSFLVCTTYFQIKKTLIINYSTYLLLHLLFLSLFQPYLILIVLAIRSFSLPGATEGNKISVAYLCHDVVKFLN